MRPLFCFATVLLSTLLPTHSQAAVTLASAVNGASYLNSALPNGKLAQGVLFIAFGSGMGPATITRANSFPLPAVLDHTSITVTVGGSTVNCIILYTTATQVAAILPSNTPTGDGTMVASYNGESSSPLGITVVAHAFGIFAVNQGGNGPGVLTDPATNAANSLINAANADKLLDIWGTGIGAAAGNDAAGPLPGDMTNLNVQVFVGGQAARVLYRGRSGCCAGVDQIRIAVPAISGCYLPVYVVVEGVVSNFTTMSAAQSGSVCSDPGGYSPSDLQSAVSNGGLRVGSVAVNRIKGRTVSGSVNNTTGILGAAFAKISLPSLLQSPGRPALGTCWVVQFPLATPPAPVYLDAGKLTAGGPIGPYDIPSPAGYEGLYTLAFIPGSPAGYPGLIGDGTMLKPGTYTFTGAGGTKVGAFTVPVIAPLTFVWNEYETLNAVNRSAPLTFRWTGGTAGGIVSITGQSPMVRGIGASFACIEDALAGSFTVPASILSALPVTYLDKGKPQGAITVVESVVGDRFAASGVDYAVAQFFDGYDIGNIAFQ